MNNFTNHLKHLLLVSLCTICTVHFSVAQTPAYFKGTGTATNAIPLNAANNATHTQQIYTPSDFNILPPSGPITKVYMRNTTAGATGTYTNFSINFLQNNLTAFPDNVFLTGFTTALSVPSITINGNAAAAGWFEIPLDIPFIYDNTKTLVYEIKYTDRTGGISTLNTNSIGNKRLSIVAPPGPATGNLANTWMDFGFDISNPCSGTPVPGSSVVTPSIACAGASIRLSLTGNVAQTNLTYTWQSSSAAAGPYTDISTASANAALDIIATATKYYRAAVSCNGGAPEYSIPVLSTVNAQFPGNTYTINNTVATGGLNFNSFTDAFNAISCGVIGKVIFNVSANQLFYENPPELNASGTVTDSIIFRKSGAGSNPVIIPINPGAIASSTTLGANGDAVITINGGDYITFDAIDINANNFSSGVDLYEYGYYLKKKSPTDAAKNVTIKNSVITLSKGIYSFGIHVSNNSGTGTVSVTSAGGASENIKISGNTISGCYGGILVRGQATAAFYDQNIYIGVDSGNVITDYGGGATTSYGIYVISQNNVKIANNTVTSVPSGHTTTLYGIYTGTSTNANVDIYNNTVTITGSGTATSVYSIYNAAGGTGTNNAVNIYNNTLTGSTYSSATTGDMYLIDQTATAYNVEISGNTLSNNTLGGTTTAALYMLYQEAAVVNESKIFNNTIAGNTKTAGTTGASYCIYNTGAATSNNQVYNNVIDNVTITATTGTLTGIHVITGATNAVYNNKISGLLNTANSTGAVYGITLASGGVINNVYNNMIVDLRAPTSTTTGTSTTDLIRGINITSATANSTQNVSFNTILLNASGGAIFSTSGVFHTTSATATTSVLNLRNNIIVNHSSASGIGFTAAYRRSSANVLGNYGSVSNKNLFHVYPTSNQVIYYDGTNSDPDLATFKARVAPRENASISEDPNFINGNSPPYDLHINAAVPTQIESGASPVAGITLDIDGQTRNATTPDIGADEFAGAPADLTGPTINYAALPVKTICIDSKTITATITDPSNVNVAAGTKPRLWFKKSYENDQLPATNTSASNGWKYVEAPGNASPFTFTFNFSLLTSPLMPGDSVSYFVVAQDIAATPNVGVSIATFNGLPPTVALSANAFPITGNINGFSVLSLPAVAIKANNTNICASGTVTLDVDNVDVTGGEYQWERSAHGADTWTDIAGATTIPFVTSLLTDTTDFRLVVKCSGVAVPASPSNVVVINVNNPQLLSTTGATRCGTGTVNLQAMAANGLFVNWYATSTSTTALFTGNTFTTPVVNTNTTFYAAGSTGAGGLASVGLPAVTPSPSSGAGTTNFGLVFDALSDFTLQSVTIYPVASTAGTAGTVTIDVINSAGAVVHTATVNVVGYPTATPTPQVVTLNFNITAGTNYKLRPGTRSSSITGLLFGPSLTGAPSYGYPFVIPGVVSINTSTLSAAPGNAARPDLYYYFYDWQVVTACVGTRVPVVATVTTPAALATTGSKVICSNTVDSIQVIEGMADFNSFVWSPATNLYTDAAATIPYSGGSALKVYVKSGTSSKTGYTVTASNSSSNCANAITDTIIVLPTPLVSSSKNDFCNSGSAVLSLDAASFYGPASIQWQTSSDGITYTDIIGANSTAYTTPTLTSTTYYKAVIKGSNGTACSQPSITINVNNPQVTGTTPGFSCGAGTVSLAATATAGAGLNWYAASTGGTSLASGNSFVTPSISATTTYYVAAGNGGTTQTANHGNPTVLTTTLNTGLLFNLNVDAVLNSVDVYTTTGSGSVVITLYNSAGTLLYTSPTFTVTTGSLSTPQTLTLNWAIPAGTGYRILVPTHTPTLGYHTGTFPIDLGNGVGTITSGATATATSTLNYFIYNMKTTTGCSSPRVAVVASINNNPGCVAPVTLLSFKGEKAETYNRLTWSTATEINNTGFELQRSADGINFNKIVFVNTKADNGNSTAILNYGFNDVSPLKGYNYYRLKQIDRDGKASYSHIVLIRGEKVNAVDIIAIYPNPVKNVLSIKLEAPQAQNATVVITDVLGQAIMQKQVQLVAGETQLQLSASKLAQGTYFARVTCSNGCQSSVHKFVKE